MPTTFAGETWYTLREASEALGKHVQTLKNWIYSGQLKANKVGNAYQVSESEIKRIRGIGGIDSNGAEPAK